MSASIDFSEIREMTIAFSGLSHMDNEYMFFYDETNNSRLFRITETDFNASKDEDFVWVALFMRENTRHLIWKTASITQIAANYERG